MIWWARITFSSMFEETFAVWLALRHPAVTFLCDFSRQVRVIARVVHTMMSSLHMYARHVDALQEMAPEQQRAQFLYMHAGGINRRHTLAPSHITSPSPFDLARAQQHIDITVGRECVVWWFLLPSMGFACTEHTVGAW